MTFKIEAAQRLQAHETFMTKRKVHAERSTGVGAGALVYAADTGRFLFGLRSAICDDPNTWCNFGGGVEEGETIEQGLKRELSEEAGYEGPIDLHHFHTTGDENFKYYNHLGVVDHEFTPTLNEEHDDFCWVPAGEFPKPLHPKFEEALNAPNCLEVLKRYCVPPDTEF